MSTFLKNTKPAIIPKPTVIIAKDTPLINFNGEFKIIFSDRTEKVAALLMHTISPSLDAEKTIWLELYPELESLGQEGYRITVDRNGIKLEAYTSCGLFYAVQTMLQMLPESFLAGKKQCFSLRETVITDKPRFEWRGLLLDSARHYQSTDFIKKLIDQMAILKLNRLHWHLMDNEACRIELADFPELTDAAMQTESPGIYTSDEIRDIIDYAEERYIKIYPEIEIPGHSRSILETFPQLRCQVGSSGKDYRQYCLGNPAAKVFLKKLIREVANIFKPEYLHLGGDEARTLHWEMCPLCSAELKRSGCTNFHQYQKLLMKEMAEYTSQFVPESIEWADHLEYGTSSAEIIQTWHEGEAEDALAAGKRIIASEHEFVYFDYYQCPEDPMRDSYMLPLDLKQVYSFDPVPSDSPFKDQVLGAEACLWTELVPENKVFYKLFPRLSAFAESVWRESPRHNRSFEEFEQRLKPYLKRLDVMGINYCREWQIQKNG